MSLPAGVQYVQGTPYCVAPMPRLVAPDPDDPMDEDARRQMRNAAIVCVMLAGSALGGAGFALLWETLAP